ncbi:hypothetical protein BGZ47_000184, partial [Haplosporangium gracile]
SHASAVSLQKPAQPQRVITKQPMTFAKSTITSATKVRSALLQQHEHEPFSAPAYLIHALTVPKKTAVPSAASASPKQIAPAPQPKPFEKALVVASKAASKSAAISNESASGTRPVVSNHRHNLHEPFNVPVHLVHAAGGVKQNAPAPKRKPAASHPAEPSEHDQLPSITSTQSATSTWIGSQGTNSPIRSTSKTASAASPAATMPTQSLPTYNDATDKHNYFRHQPHDETCDEHHDEFRNLLPTAAGDSPLQSMRKLFSAANSIRRGDYTYAEAITHKRSPHSNTMSAPMKKRPALKLRCAFKASPGSSSILVAPLVTAVIMPRKYDIQGPSRHRQKHKRSQTPLIPSSWFDEPPGASIARHAPAASAPEDATTRRHLENKRRGNSIGHHDADDTTNKHDHFRHQPYDVVCDNDYHDELGNLRASAASDSRLLSIRRLFSAANSSALRGHTYSEAVTHTRRHPHQNPQKKQNNISTPGINLGALFAESLPVPPHHQKNDSNHPRGHLRHNVVGAPKSLQGNVMTLEMNLGSLFPDNEFASNQQHSREHLDLNPIERPDYDVEGPQHRNDQKRLEQKNTDGFHIRIQVYAPISTPHGVRTRHSGTDLCQADSVTQYRPTDEYRGPLSQHRPATSSTSSTSHPHLHSSPSKNERKQVQKEQLQAHRKLRKALHQVPALAPAPPPYNPDGGLLEDYVFSEAVEQHSKHHAPYPDSLEAHQYHAQATDHAHVHTDHVGLAAKGLKSGHTHISDYQKQPHHHDLSTQNPLQPQAQPQQQYVSKKSNNDGPEGYLRLSPEFFKQPLSPDYYADDVNAKSAPQFLDDSTSSPIISLLVSRIVSVQILPSKSTLE